MDGVAFSPFSEETRTSLMQSGEIEPPSVELVQGILDDLNEKDFIWKKSYGTLVLADSDMKNVLRDIVENETNAENRSDIESSIDNPPGF